MGTTSAIAGLATNGAAVVVALAVTLWAGHALQNAALRASSSRQRTRRGRISRIAATPVPSGPAPPDVPSADATFAGQDRNGDGRLNADEVPGALRARFAEVDADGDGYVEKAEWDRAVATVPDAPPGRGKVIAQRVFTAADDFVVDVWHNGRRVADDKRADGRR